MKTNHINNNCMDTNNNCMDTDNKTKYCDLKKDSYQSVIIGITGRKRSGKDTIGQYLVNNHGFVRVAFADSLKEACKIIFGFSDEQVYGDELKEVIDEYWSHSPREVLQKVGTELFRDRLPEVLQHMSNDIWIRSVDRQIQNLSKQGYRRFVITDVRFLNELDFISRKYGYSWKVIRPGLETASVTHASEAMIDDFKCDHDFLNNRTLNDLYQDVDLEINKILKDHDLQHPEITPKANKRKNYYNEEWKETKTSLKLKTI